MLQLIDRYDRKQGRAVKPGRLADPDCLLRLAETFDDPDTAGQEVIDAFSFILHDLLIDGTWKRTNSGRLPLTESVLCSHIPSIAGEIHVLDLGASDGITTIELTSALRKSFGDRVRVHLADLNISLLRFRKGPVFEYRTTHGTPVMTRIGRVGLRLSARRQQEGVSDPIAKLYLSFDRFRRSMRLDKAISVVHPLVQREAAITVIELDCLASDKELSERFDAIRASNILNIDYFSAEQLRSAVGNMHGYLREGGCLLVSRNEDRAGKEIENGSVWRKVGSRFTHLTDFGAGSEIKAIVDEWDRGHAARAFKISHTLVGNDKHDDRPKTDKKPADRSWYI